MSKPYLVVEVLRGNVGVIRERDTHEEAIDAAVEMAKEQSRQTVTEIRTELEENGDFRDGDIYISLAQAED